MKKFTLSGFIAILLIFTISVNASNSVISVSTEKTSTQVMSSTPNEMNIQFHFGDINYFDVKTPMGIFTEIHMENAYSTNRVGEPILPAQRKLIAIPFGAEVNVQVSSFNVQTISLGDNGIKNVLMPLQYDIPKNMEASEIPFEFNTEAYNAKSFNESEIAKVEILGVMRGVRIARITVEPARYNPSTNELEIYNDIEVSLSYENADWDLTNQTFKSTYSPTFDMVYKSLLNIDDVYDDHPDLLTFPVRMLIVSAPMFTDALQPFIEWKTMMGYELTVAYTDEIGNSISEIQTWVHNEYNEGVANGNTPNFLVLVGDVQQVPASTTGSSSGRKTDLYYASVDGDYFPEMYYGRLSAQNVPDLTSQLDKILYYEKYEFATPDFLDDVTLIAGADGSWNPAVGQPTIIYGTDNYYNAEHGYENIWVYLDSYSGCYDDERFQTSFINYTAHCAETVWADPHLGISDVNSMSNPNEYPIAIGNCCMSADFGYGECIGETFLRRDNGGAVGYIGSSPSSYWFEDFYWSVGAFPISGNNNGYVPT
ncbi:MAG: peptidase C25, partial [Bacteroidales bacterium]|nr:peptidase C25 [Bacteroidales bacterium]